MSRLQDVLLQGTHAARPAAATGNTSYYYWESDTQTLFQSTGSAWVQLAPAVAAPAVRAYNNAVVSCAASTLTTVPLNTTSFDQGTSTPQHSTSSNTNRLTCQQAGIYSICGTVHWNGTTGGTRRIIRLRLNGTTDIGGAETPAPTSSGNEIMLCASAQYSLAVSDYVDMYVYQDSTGSINLLAPDVSSPALSMARVA